MAIQKQSLYYDSAALRHTVLLRHHRPLGHPQQQPRRFGRHQKQEGKVRRLIKMLKKAPLLY